MRGTLSLRGVIIKCEGRLTYKNNWMTKCPPEEREPRKAGKSLWRWGWAWLYERGMITIRGKLHLKFTLWKTLCKVLYVHNHIKSFPETYLEGIISFLQGRKLVVREFKKLAACGRTLQPTSSVSIWQDLEGMVDFQQAELRERLLEEETQKQTLGGKNYPHIWEYKGSSVRGNCQFCTDNLLFSPFQV